MLTSSYFTPFFLLLLRLTFSKNVAIFFDILHLFWIRGTFDLLTPFVDQLKNPTGAGRFTLNL